MSVDREEQRVRDLALYRVEVIDYAGATRCSLLFGSRREAELVLNRWTKNMLDQATMQSFDREPWTIHLSRTAA